jgi:hypothetical protein
MPNGTASFAISVNLAASAPLSPYAVSKLAEEHLAIFRRHMVDVIDIEFDLLSEEIGRLFYPKETGDEIPYSVMP